MGSEAVRARAGSTICGRGRPPRLPKNRPRWARRPILGSGFLFRRRGNWVSEIGTSSFRSPGAALELGFALLERPRRGRARRAIFGKGPRSALPPAGFLHDAPEFLGSRLRAARRPGRPRCGHLASGKEGCRFAGREARRREVAVHLERGGPRESGGAIKRFAGRRPSLCGVLPRAARAARQMRPQACRRRATRAEFPVSSVALPEESCVRARSRHTANWCAAGASSRFKRSNSPITPEPARRAARNALSKRKRGGNAQNMAAPFPLPSCFLHKKIPAGGGDFLREIWRMP